MSFEWFVARRYLTARRKQAFISLISAVSILGVGVGVMALVIALALMTGVQGELRDRIVGSTAHIYVYKIGGRLDDVESEIGRLTRDASVVAGAPAVVGHALLSSSRSTYVPVQLKGIVPSLETRVTEIGTSVESGSVEALVGRPADATDGIVLGADLARTLGVTLRDTVLLVTPEATLTPLGPTLRVRKFQVVGIVRFGFYTTDSAWAFVALDTAAHLLNRDGPDLLQLRLDDLDRAPVVRARLQDQLGVGYHVEDWTQTNGELYSALWLEKVAISITIGLIVMVAALNIVASLVLLVMEKSRDIAILRTMGAPAGAIRKIFVYQGLAIGLIGTAAGTVLGLAVCRVADRYQLITLPSDVYQITYLPFHVQAGDVMIVVVSAIAVCLLATLYPARQASRLDPAEALRNP